MSELYSTNVVIDITGTNDDMAVADAIIKSPTVVESDGILNESQLLINDTSFTVKSEATVDVFTQMSLDVNATTTTLTGTITPELKNDSGFTEMIIELRDLLKTDISLNLNSDFGLELEPEVITPLMVNSDGFYPSTVSNPISLRFSFDKKLLSVEGFKNAMAQFANNAKVTFEGKTVSSVDVSKNDNSVLSIAQGTTKSDFPIIEGGFLNTTVQLASVIGFPSTSYALRAIPGLQVFYDFENISNGTVTDEAGDNDGIGTFTVQPGYSGNGIYLNGTDSELYSPYIVSVEENYSVAFRFKTAIKDKEMVFVTDGDGSIDYVDASLLVGVDATNNFMFGFGDGTVGYIDSTVSALSYLDDAWHLISVVYTNASIQLLVDNVVLKTFVHGGTLTDGTNSLAIGCDTSSNNKYEGLLDTFRVFETNLTTEENSILADE